MSRSSSRHRRRRRNPGYDADFVKHFRDGGRIEVWNDGEVCIYDAMDTDQDDFFLQPKEVERFKREIEEAPHSRWHHFQKDMISDDFALQGRKRKVKSSNPFTSRGQHMGRSRRRTSYKKNRRWNPSARPNENDIPTVRMGKGGKGRNPRYSRHLSDGGVVEVDDLGLVTVKDRSGHQYDRYSIDRGHLRSFINDLRHAGKRSMARDWSANEGVLEEAYAARRNPRHRRGRGRKQARGRGRRRNPAQFPMPFTSAMNPRRRGRKRRNPAQFPMPFTSAMNPRRRRRNCGGMPRGRNHPISRRDASAMKRVLRQHRYSC